MSIAPCMMSAKFTTKKFRKKVKKKYYMIGNELRYLHTLEAKGQEEKVTLTWSSHSNFVHLLSSISSTLSYQTMPNTEQRTHIGVEFAECIASF
jgi:hypothetical protein